MSDETAEALGETLANVVEVSDRSRIRRHADRSRPELAEEALRTARVAHVGFAVEGQPYVLPMLFHYEDGAIYLHGAQANRTLRALRAGAQVCVEVTLLDGLVASRDALNHSANYRSVILFGQAEEVEDTQQKRAIFERMTERYFSGRQAGVDYLPAREGELRATALLRVAVEELSAKARSGPPNGPLDADEEGFGSRYVLILPGHED